MEVETYRHTHHVPEGEPCVLILVAFIVHDPESAHYFAVVFDYAAYIAYAAHIAYVFGRRISDSNPEYNSDWRAWRGPE